jgi:hypothetical protein
VKKRAWIFFIAAVLSQQGFSATVADLVDAYKRGDFKYVCLQGPKLFNLFQKDEDLVMMYAFSCLKIDYVDRLAVPILALGKTPESRRNRAYLSLILTQKNILTNALIDNEKYEGLRLPTTDNVLSKVFDLYFQKKYRQEGDEYIMEENGTRYRVYTRHHKGRDWVYIEESDISGNTRIHMYK